MKNYIFIAAVLLVILVSCKNDTSKNDGSATYQRDSLLDVIEKSEMSVNEYIAYFNEVERNLDSVTVRQHIILENTDKKDLKAPQKAKIVAEIKAINELMDANNKKLKELSRKFRASNKKNTELEKTIDILNNQLAVKYMELMDMNEDLRLLNDEIAEYKIAVDTLMIRNGQLAQTIAKNIDEMHTAYYVVGNSADLQKWNLVDKQGGFLGIGQTAKLSNNLDHNMFTEIDYTKTTTIPINSKGVKIVTTHPTGSFTVNKKGRIVESITIDDPERFWSTSKYLVVTL
jgi:myosin heavy subunit